MIRTEPTWKRNGQICAGSARKGEDAKRESRNSERIEWRCGEKEKP